MRKNGKKLTSSFPAGERGVKIMQSEEDARASFLNNDTTARISISELHQILEETNKRKKAKEAPAAAKTIVDNNYDELVEENETEEAVDVRALEKWKLEMKKKKSINNILQNINK
jgi:recombinational DNA repair protein (RecF pathway)